MSDNSYDSYAAFEKALQSLANFNKLIEKRRRAYPERTQRLNEWIVLGRFYFDFAGNVYKFTHQGIPAEMFPHFPQVMAYKDYETYLKKYLEPYETRPVAPFHANIPPADYRCPECGENWTVENCHDVVLDTTGIRHFRHHNCYHDFQTRTEKEYFESVFKDAGYKDARFLVIKNPYCNVEFCPPWFNVIADGISFTIGNWRKRLVIIISYDSRVDFTKICPDCDVTKGADFIHAWGRDMAVTYLILAKKAVISDMLSE